MLEKTVCSHCESRVMISEENKLCSICGKNIPVIYPAVIVPLRLKLNCCDIFCSYFADLKSGHLQTERPDCNECTRSRWDVYLVSKSPEQNEK